MKPLLIAFNAKYIHTNNAVRLLKANSTHDLTIKEFTIKDQIETILHYIINQRPLFVGFSTYIWNVEMIKTLIKKLKAMTDIPIILGGPEVSYDAEYFLTHTKADIIVKGEGEHVIDDIIAYYKDNKPLYNTPSIQTKTLNTPIKENHALNTLKSPHRFKEDQDDLKNRIMYIESSRGCPFKCSYCLSSLEKTVRFFDIEAVKSDILYLLKRGAKTFKFLDRTFNANKKAFDIIDFIIENHTQESVFQFEITGDTLDNDLVDYIHAHAKKGLFRFEIGIQSTHPITNELVGRIQDNEKLFSMIKKIIHHDVIDLHLDLIAGLPKENLNRFKQTFDDVFDLGAKELQLGFLKMLRGTLLRRQAPLYNYQFADKAPYEILQNDHLSHCDIQTIQKVETMLEIFHNKNYFDTYLFSIIKSHTDQYFDFFLNLYEAYKDNNLPLIGYQLEPLYRFITNYLKALNIEEEKLETLKYLYLAKAKTKPKLYFEKISDKKLRQSIIQQVQSDYQIPQNKLYKNSITAYYKEGYLLALYQHHQSKLYFINQKISYSEKL